MTAAEQRQQRGRQATMGAGAYGSKLASYFHLGHSSSATGSLPNNQTFAVTHLHSTTGLPDRTLTVEPDPALHVSVALVPVPKGIYRLWIAGKEVAVPYIPEFGMSLVDLESSPAATCTGAFDYLHFYVPRKSLNDIADDLGGNFFSHHRERRGGLSPMQRRRAEELLRAHLDGKIALATLARQCNVSVSHFARTFKASFGMSVHRWLTQERVTLAKDLLLCTALPLADIGLRSGFSDQSAFTRAFSRATGSSPGHWRKRHKQ